MRIQVTQNDIDYGVRNSDCSCPVALAVNREVEGIDNISVCQDNITYKFGHAKYLSRLDISTVEWIRNFDEGLFVKPFTFWFNWERKEQFI